MPLGNHRIEINSFLLGILLFILFAWGSLYRCHGLDRLILGGDERHALHIAITHTVESAYTYHGEHDNSIPLTLYAQFLMKTLGFNELKFRLPVVLSGLLLLFVPLLFFRQLGSVAVLITTALFAVSPIMIYYTFVARPYAPAALFVCLSLYTIFRGVREGRRRWFLLFGLAASIAVYFHLYSIFAVVALFVSSLFVCHSNTTKLRYWILSAILFSAVLVVLLAPGVTNLWSTRLAKLNQGDRSIRVMLRAILLIAGFSTGAMLLSMLCILFGFVSMWKKCRFLAGSLAVMILVQGVGLWITNPVLYYQAWARYFFPALPPALLLCGSGFVYLQEKINTVFKILWGRIAIIGLFSILIIAGIFCYRIRRQDLALFGLIMLWPLGVLVFTGCACYILNIWHPTRRFNTLKNGAVFSGAVCIVGFVFLSPLDIYWMQKSSFRSGPSSLRPVRRTRATELPSAYRYMMECGSESDLILEYPPAEWIAWELYDDYQRLHGREVKFAAWIPTVENRKVELCNVVDLRDASSLSSSGGRYLFVHRDFPSEFASRGLGYLRAEWIPRVTSNELDFIHRRFGPPLIAEDGIELFALNP
jgi:4-amino-4-deoxy-L-arabinose transferase-like glycosyltransferase